MAFLVVAALLAPVPAAASGAPGTPSSVSVERADGTLTASWPAVSGATGYHITYSSDARQSWSLAAYDHAATSITIDGVSNSAAYVVGVRALNSGGGSGWRNSPSAGPWTPPPAPPPPAMPESVSVERADGTLTASWPAVSGATGYHVTYSADAKQSWSLAAYDHAGTSISIDGVSNSAAYVVGVRALNASGGSGWRNSPSAGPWATPPAMPSSVSVLRTDGALTASWPAVSGAAGYHITYSSDGKHSWSRMALNHADTSIYLNGLSNTATYFVAVRARNAGGDSGWRNSPASGPWTSPGTVENLEIEPGDGYFDIEWDALAGATGYDVRAKAENSSTWHDVAAGVSGTSHRYTTAVALDYVAVRARSNGNAGPWTEISRMPSEDFWTAYDAQTVGAMSLAGGQGLVAAEAQGATNKLGKVTWGKIERTTRRLKAVFDVRWEPVTGADGYNFVCSEYSGWHWDVCGWEVSGPNSTVSYATVPTSHTQPLSITHFWRKDGRHTPGKYRLGRHRHTMLAVRAVKNNDPSAAGPWAQTAEIPPFHTYLRDFSYTRGDGQISMSWTPNFWITGYEIYCAVAVAGQAADYKRCATMSDQDDTAAQHSVTISAWTVDGTSYSIDNTKLYDIAIYSTNTWGRGRWLPPLMDPITLTASSITATSATLTLAEYTGTWWLKRTTPASTNCKSMGTAAATGATEDLTGLTPGASHTYKAYSDSSCTNEIVSGSFTTLASLTASSVTDSGATLTIAGHTGDWWYKADAGHHTTCQGPVSATSETVTGLPSDSTYTYTAYDKTGCASADALDAVTFTTNRNDYDADDDGLIEIRTLAQLNALRWDLDGNGQVTGANQSSYRSAFPTASNYTGVTAMGCPNTCQGYELDGDLDFDTNASGSADSGDAWWNSGRGWTPIGGYRGALDGNGRAIKNLYIDSTADQWVGLFAHVEVGAALKNLVLVGVDVTGSAASAAGVGALAGQLKATATAEGISVYGTVAADRDGGRRAAGGIVGQNLGSISDSASHADVTSDVGSGSGSTAEAGGIVGDNRGSVATAYFTGAVTAIGGTPRSGGIAGNQESNGTVKASYSTGTARSTGTTLARAGGIVGRMENGSVTAAYATGQIRKGNSQTPLLSLGFHGVVGFKINGTVTDAYFDQDTVLNVLTNADNVAKTTSELQTPTEYGTGTSIYADWNLDLDSVTGGDDPWDFGTSSEYPVLKDAPVALTASSITATGATLTIANHNGGWWHKGSQAGATCTSIAAGTKIASLTQLTAATVYTYTAYSDATCTTKLATATFTTS